ncbi:hypothetical protein [Bifidobacterium longum]|uniref:hypothetical protein n=1 Tax=Bifidobacterium longum TaxID=216816 RepID=UPI00145B3C7C|nr:hypothetical protein [Bifidobacterium longum]
MELVILLFVVLAVACFGLLLPFLRLAVGIVFLVVRLLASLARSMGAGDDAPHTRDRRRFRFRRVLSADVRPVPRGHAPRHARGPLA